MRSRAVPTEPGVYPDLQGFAVRATDGTGYRVDIAAGVLDPAHLLLAGQLTGRQVQVFTGPTVSRLYGRSLNQYLGAHLEPASWQVHTIVTGEAGKTLATVEHVGALAKAGGLDRRGIMVAVGGGVTADIVGFAASMFARGVDYLKVNTTLLSQVDVGVGVKNGVNALGSKNMFGTYHAATASINDLEFLRTLPAREIRCGLGEIVKMAVIADAGLFSTLERHPSMFKVPCAVNPTLMSLQDQVTRRAMRLMLEELHTNLREHDLARLVDFGHTFSPLIEVASGHRIAHGEAVAIDMALSAQIAALLGVLGREEADRIVGLLARLGLPVHDRQTCTVALMTRALQDARERRGRQLNLVLPTAIGAATFIDEVPADVLAIALAQLAGSCVARSRGLPA